MSDDVSAINEAKSQGRLLKTLAEELKIPLLQIARASELARLSGDMREVERTEVLADTVLRLLDSYVLSTQTMLGQQTLELEPVSLNAIMYDTAQYLYKVAKLYDCEIELSTSSRYGLVMANHQALQAALTSLGYSFINSMNESGASRIILMTGRNKYGIAAGVQTTDQEVGNNVLKQAKALYGVARQPLPSLTHASGAGFMVANSLFDAMATQLRVIKQRGNTGLAATLLPSQQLALL